MKTDFMPVVALAHPKKISFAILCCAVFVLVTAPAWAQNLDPCSGALVNEGSLGSAYGCGAVITVTSVDSNGNANAWSITIPSNDDSPGNGNPYDGSSDDDLLVGIVNNSGSTLNSITLTSSDITFGGIFAFDGNGPCNFAFQNYYGNEYDCFNGTPFPFESKPEADPFDYAGPSNEFSNINFTPCSTSEEGCATSGTVTFYTPCDETCPGIATGTSTWFALRGTPNSLTLTSETQTLTYTAGTNETQTATFGSGNSQNMISFTIPTVYDTFTVTVTANYVNTEFSTGGQTGIGIADGVCEQNSPFNGTVNGVNQYPDYDVSCRLAAGGFVFTTLSNGDKVVPHAFPYHNGQAVWYRATTTGVAVSQGGHDYAGPVADYWTWEVNPSLTMPPVNPEYPPGWNNTNGRVYDRPGTLANSTTPNPNNAFVADITTSFQDPGAGGKQATLNDWVLAAIPNPETGNADTEVTLLPLPFVSPAPYVAGLPMPVSFALVNSTTKKFDPTALTLPNSVNISTSISPTQNLPTNNIPLQFPKGFPTTFQCVMLKNTCTGVYGIVLSSAPYQKGVVYNMQIGSDLFSAPVNIPFVVK
jgi:hypothetical protein